MHNTSLCCNVLIIGGGIAGLSAAHYFNSVGMTDFLIVEADNRLGGRIYSDLTTGIEIGAEFIHGEGNMAYDIIVNKMKVPLDMVFDFSKTDPKQHGAMYFIDGKLHGIDSPVAKQMLKYIDDLMNDEQLKKGPDMSVQEWLISRKVPEKYHVFIDSLLAKTNGGCLLSASAKGLQEEGNKWPYGSGNFQLNGDHYMEPSMMKYLTSNLCLKDQVKLNYKVYNIDYTCKSGMIKVNNGEIMCNKVILTVPISVLRSQQIVFNPPLSPLKRHIIQNMLPMQSGMKVVLRFKRPFWRDLIPDTNIIILGDNHPFIAQLWFPHVSQKKHDEFGYYLTGFSMGNKTDNALFYSEEEITKSMRQLVQKVFNLNSNNDGYIGGIVKNWQSFQFVGGSYSFAGVTDASRMNFVENCREVLAEPIENRIFFAGEAYADYSPASLHGSLETGQKAAQSIMSKHSKL
ncbi:hypothetical protein FDP41_005182 [Naegleria fowleri]|uniref:Amine oxidase domain-containing protein n=1 Tax=Naegleria fowleri TaxID=5763 RepID=A0A6A5BR11_NAEFO|nr:uncharacterized protein FDP41_005182 [Naegleria fowleri]KAF0975855.1 hypothetical protein FDP41_005182 [Naegleria fowleri]